MTGTQVPVGAAALVVASCVATASADTFSLDLDGLETRYGGLIGDPFEQTDFDFGLGFAFVEAATLHLSGVTDVAGSTLVFAAYLDDVMSPLFIEVSDGTFDVEVPLVVGPGLLDGAGAGRRVRPARGGRRAAPPARDRRTVRRRRRRADRGPARHGLRHVLPRG
jgi:hypothetical protein